MLTKGKLKENINIKANTRCKTIPPCRDEVLISHAIIGLNLFRLDVLRFHPGKPGSCTYYFSCCIMTSLSTATPGQFSKQVFLKISQKLTHVQESIFNKFAGFRLATLLKRDWNTWFPVNSAKVICTPFYRVPLNDCS